MGGACSPWTAWSGLLGVPECDQQCLTYCSPVSLGVCRLFPKFHQNKLLEVNTHYSWLPHASSGWLTEKFYTHITHAIFPVSPSLLRLHFLYSQYQTLTFLSVWLHAVAFRLLHFQRILLFIQHSAGGLLLISRDSLRSVLLSYMRVASVPCHKDAYGSVALKSTVILRRKVRAMT